VLIQKAHKPSKVMIERALSIDGASLASAYFRRLAVKKFASNRGCILYTAREGGRMAGYALFCRLEWDSAIFGLKIGRIERLFIRMRSEDAGRFIGRIIDDCSAEGYDHIVCRTGISDLNCVAALEKAGFVVADVQLTLNTPERWKGRYPDTAFTGSAITKAATRDLPALRSVVKGVFTDTRFVTDERYPKDKVDRMYYEWLRGAVSSGDKRLFIARNKKGGATGFVLCDVARDSKAAVGAMIGSIGLIAVSEACRNKGIGQELVRYALSHFEKEGVDKVEIRTQMSNIPAIRAFIKSGLSEITHGIVLPAGITMHYWF